MTVAELYQAIATGGTGTAALVIGTPLVIGVASLYLRANGKNRASQTVANFGIAIGLAALSIEIFALIYAMDHLGINPLTDVDLFLMLGPVYLLGVGFLIEHLIHPGTQHNIRRKFRSGILVVIILGVLYFLLSKLELYMLILSSMMGFIMFILFLIGVLYLVVKRVI